ncbi:S8/S53 family peptidase [Fulvivirgaceae bacterium BMA10]|uniref:S8/S53 family peptidase n=1 Tax=Splendidivirga corallicola TaxID=3051826 RepID=A0ABT8KVW9_9BACT|nr:S8/S53 family peptidase [Fulvivirgaceae bacterium BMA10]
MKVLFEIFLTGEPEKRKACIQKINEEFNVKLKPLFEHHASLNTSMDLFYKMSLKTNESDAWIVANKLMAIEGVEDVDPAVYEMNEAIELEPDQDEIEGANESTETPHPNWIHKNSRFSDAISYAKEEGQKGRGNYTGGQSGIKIAQLDTGYSNHPEIAAVKKEQGWNYVYTIWDRIRSLLFNWKPAKRVAKDRLRTLRPFKWAAHGTATAAIIIGQPTLNRGITSKSKDRTDGVFPYVDLIPYRVSETIISFNNKVAHAAFQAIKDGCKIITMSHAGLLRKRSWKEAAAAAYEAGVIWVAATGSHIKNIKTVWLYPAKFPEVITAAASKPDDTVWEKSFAGNKVEISAPGYQIYVPFARKGRKYRYKWSEGTSFSTPMVAAAAALWLAHHGEKKLTEVYDKGWQQVEAFRWCLKKSANTPAVWDKELHGEGLLDVRKLLEIDLPPKDGLVHATKGKLTKKMENEEAKKRYIQDKEITYLTACAKMELRDERKNETYDFVKKRASSISVDRIREIVEVNDEDNSELLKAHVKKHAEDWNY